LSDGVKNKSPFFTTLLSLIDARTETRTTLLLLFSFFIYTNAKLYVFLTAHFER